jgi:hypothetical protein
MQRYETRRDVKHAEIQKAVGLETFREMKCGGT